MNYNEFKQALMASVENELQEQNIEGITLKNEEIMSADGMTDRLIVSMEGSNISMAFRLQEIYDQYDGDITAQAASLVETIKENLQVKEKEAYVKSFITDFEQAKKHFVLRLIPGDSPALTETPHEKIEDMALVVNLHLEGFSDENGRACVIVNDSLMRIYGVSKDELFAIARKNSLDQEPMKFEPMQSLIANMIKDDDFEMPGDMGDVAFVATNRSGFQGAAVIGYPGFAEKASEAVGGSYYLIGSSVHELILIKDNDGINAKSINNMIKDVNETVLSPRDRLSEQCYHYDADAKILETGLTYDARHRKTKAEMKAS